VDDAIPHRNSCTFLPAHDVSRNVARLHAAFMEEQVCVRFIQSCGSNQHRWTTLFNRISKIATPPPLSPGDRIDDDEACSISEFFSGGPTSESELSGIREEACVILLIFPII